MTMTNNAPTRACLWLRVSTDNKGQDPSLQRADMEGLCQRQGWEIVQVYEVEESAFGKRPRQQFQRLMEEARQRRFDVLVVWSMDRFSREGEWSVSRMMAALQDWHVHFYSYSEPFLDTSGPFGGVLIPLFAWLARQESIRKGAATRLGMAKARSRGINLGRPCLMPQVAVAQMAELRQEGKTWAQAQAAHPRIHLGFRRYGPPSVRSIRRAVEAWQKGLPAPAPEIVRIETR